MNLKRIILPKYEHHLGFLHLIQQLLIRQQYGFHNGLELDQNISLRKKYQVVIMKGRSKH